MKIDYSNTNRICDMITTDRKAAMPALNDECTGGRILLQSSCSSLSAPPSVLPLCAPPQCSSFSAPHSVLLPQCSPSVLLPHCSSLSASLPVLLHWISQPSLRCSPGAGESQRL